MTRFGLVVMAYGTPASPDDVESYYTHIRRGRPPSAEQLADLVRRYGAIGGISPLAQRTEAQRAALAAALEQRDPGQWTVVLGQKHAAPFIEDSIEELITVGVELIVGLVLAPHYSRASVGQYHERAAEVATARSATRSTSSTTGPISYVPIESWHLEPAYLDFLTAAVRDARFMMPVRHKVLFTAHSLPERALVGDPYPDQLRASATAVAERVGLGPWADWTIGWQSAGRTPEPWRGPDILEIIRQLGETGRCEGVLVCPQGFTADHLEVLYDLDIEAARVATEHGLTFARTRSLNDDITVMEALVDRVLREQLKVQRA